MITIYGGILIATRTPFYVGSDMYWPARPELHLAFDFERSGVNQGLIDFAKANHGNYEFVKLLTTSKNERRAFWESFFYHFYLNEGHDLKNAVDPAWNPAWSWPNGRMPNSVRDKMSLSHSIFLQTVEGQETQCKRSSAGALAANKNRRGLKRSEYFKQKQRETQGKRKPYKRSIENGLKLRKVKLEFLKTLKGQMIQRKRSSAGGAANLGKKRQNISISQTKYWEMIHTIMSELRVTAKEARKVYTQRKDNTQ